VDKIYQDVYVFHSEEYPSVLLYCVKRWVKVTKEGPVEYLFLTAATKDQALPAAVEAVQAPLPKLPRGNTEGFLAEEIAAMRAAGIAVDDDNDPAPENIPTTTKPGELQVDYNEWGFNGVCYCRSKGCSRAMPSINTDFATREQQRTMNRGAWFLLAFPIDWLVEVMLKNINENLLGSS